MPTTLWIDVEDFFIHGQSVSRLSGVQRLTFEMYATLVAEAPPDLPIRFVRHDEIGGFLAPVPWSEMVALHARLSAGNAPVPVRDAGRRPPSSRRRQRSIPVEAQVALDRFHLLQASVWTTLRTALFAPPHTAAVAPPDPPTPVRTIEAPIVHFAPHRNGTDVGMAPGDVLLALGATWVCPDYAALLRHARAIGLSVVVLFYDLIPIRHPEWCERAEVARFTDWLAGVIPCCDVFLAISQATARDLTAYCAKKFPDLAVGVTTIPVGSGFTSGAMIARTGPAAFAVSRRSRRGLPAPGSYVLVVSTIEARKNHLLLFRVWRRLIEELPFEQVPLLVLAGRVGALVSALMQQIENSRYLEGKIRLIEAPDDDVVETLYRGALFSVFPSLSEGWGLPVTESLSFGTPCMISDATSLPEAGGDLARYFGPNDGGGAYRVIRAALDDRSGLERWRSRVQREFRPTPWSATAAALLAALPLHAERAVGAAEPVPAFAPRA